MAHGAASVGVDTVDGVPDSITVNGMPVGATVQQLADWGALLTATDQSGIDRRVFSPPPFTYRYWDDPRATLDLHRLLNDATASLVAAHPDRFVGLATVPLQDNDLAIAELRRAREELGLAGLTLGTNVAGGNIADDVRRPLLAAAAASDTPILVHPDFVPNARWATHYLINLLGMPVDSGIALANLAFGGRLAEFPELRVCFVHGGGVAPYLLGRWDRGWKVRSETKTDIHRPPSTQLTRVFCDTLTHSPEALAYLVDVMGPDRVVVGTDSPFDVEDAAPLASLEAAPRLNDDDRATIRSVSPLAWLHGPG
jgi:aminocarboxymuconate-semialdehyde decarboxylase